MKLVVKDLEAFKELLLKKGYTQTELAKKLSISRNYVSQVVNGRNLSPTLASKICKLLEVDFNAIFEVKKLSKIC